MPFKSNTLFQNYFSAFKDYDEVLKPDMSINPKWEKVFNNFSKIGYNNLIAKQDEVNWLMEENGVTYNVYNDPNGMNRAWDLNIVPFVIHESEWETTIERGLKQRAELLNLILKDIYGKRELFKNGIVPQEVVFAHRGFLRQCDQIQYNTSKNLQIYSADLARGPDGRMWVVSDRSQAPSGMGYALENRYALNRVVPTIFENINVKHPLSFFNDLKQMLLDAVPQNKSNPNIVILTPGPHNETYFEHAYLGSFLGYPLVMGSDLVVRNGKLWLKTLKKLKQVDVVLRRVDDFFMDPLELREDSYLGVAGLLEVVREQQVAIVNPVGSGILENSGLIPFMNAICNYFFKEDLILPQIASWWCGQKKELDYVLNHLKDLVVKRIDRSNRENIFFCEFLDDAALAKLKKEITLAPYQFVAQEKISFSTAPNFVNGTLEPRKVLCRTFAIAKKDSYSIMPGGLVRVAAERENLFVSNQRGGISKDFWIVSDQLQNPLRNYSWDASSNNYVSDINDLSSNTAENLYWSGRYLSRALVTARYLRMVLNRMHQDQYSTRKSDSESLTILYKSITNITSTFPGFVGKGSEALLKNPLKEIISLITDEKRLGSLAQNMASFNNSYYSLRSLWSKDMWRVFDGIKKQWQKFNENDDFSINALSKFLDRIITRLIAFMALIEESILVNQGLLLYFIGLQTEQAMMHVEKCRAILVINYNEQVQYEILESLLNSSESLNIYRYSYRSYLSIENVTKLILLDKDYAKSLAYQVKRIEKDVSRLPYSEGANTITACKEKIMKAHTKMNSLHIETLLKLDEDALIRQNLDDTLAEISDLLHQTAMEISNTYFNHAYTQNQLTNQNFPQL
ncbi:MAG: circularly permuted type 2 ATP-grasp protein [Algibacter sp.]|uniref:circularly permuted type 2 ATP-grasp protein n=1 Tax=Algibacter sp. TaxID=1872428 RepID=UPI0026240066|nr:circularly permuted type 2 ATP-grasp protein [Algibacter sp.]MDG1730073.1 circularly permuted type 2 ATP-grasp protein [Algibacter sp.]MDG2179815.1 circularly permuted type 2 ATP-grasp protein [Algibacter sp.]